MSDRTAEIMVNVLLVAGVAAGAAMALAVLSLIVQIAVAALANIQPFAVF